MRSSYKRIGDYIQLIDERNRDLSITTLLGLSIDKVFIPSVANTVGSDMANYKIIRKGQFACSLMQVRRDKKIPVAMLYSFEEAIISQAYPVFEIVDTEDLLPEYLMMWMSRSEFDREACFYAVGGVRGSLEWDDFCNMELPVPSIEKQREIVKEYHPIVDRIKLNKQLNQKLEETAQAIYKQWFVDFEFPIDSPPVEGWQAKPDGVVPFKRDTKAYRSLPYNPKLKDRAKALRKAGVLSEVLIWQEVHKMKFKGLDFDRQKIIGNYIVDFYCPNLNVVIEIDGSSHNDKQEYDAERDAYLKGLGLTVIHIKDIDVKRNLQGVMDYLREHEAFQMDCGDAENNHPALRAPLQRRGIGYKSGGGEMVWNDELDQEIPKGWDSCEILELFELQRGFDLPSQKRLKGETPIYAANGLTDFHSESKVRGPAVVTGRSGTIGNVFYVSKDCWPLNTTLWIKSFNIATPLYAYLILKNTELKGFHSGSAVPTLNRNDIHTLLSIKPSTIIIKRFEEQQRKVFNHIDIIIEEVEQLTSLRDILLAKMTKVEAVA